MYLTDAQGSQGVTFTHFSPRLFWVNRAGRARRRGIFERQGSQRTDVTEGFGSRDAYQANFLAGSGMCDRRKAEGPDLSFLHRRKNAF